MGARFARSGLGVWRLAAIFASLVPCGTMAATTVIPDAGSGCDPTDYTQTYVGTYIINVAATPTGLSYEEQETYQESLSGQVYFSCALSTQYYTDDTPDLPTGPIVDPSTSPTPLPSNTPTITPSEVPPQHYTPPPYGYYWDCFYPLGRYFPGFKFFCELAPIPKSGTFGDGVRGSNGQVIYPNIALSGGGELTTGTPGYITVLASSINQTTYIPFVVDGAPGTGASLSIYGPGGVLWSQPLDLFTPGQLYFAVVSPQAPDSVTQVPLTYWLHSPTTGTAAVFLPDQVQTINTTVPNAIGQTQAAASATLSAAELVVGTVTLHSSTTVTAGSVISESPAAGTSVQVDSGIDLVVSSGRLLGDVNGDGVVNCVDLQLVKAAFNSKRGQPAYNPNADLNGDGVINIVDLSIVARTVPAGTVCQ